jgi:AcrR family transcriptional regulator
MPRTKEQNEEIRRQTKNTILNSALKLFAKKGFHGTSISDIAKDAGISKGLAYNYFESKSQLVDEIFEMGMQELVNSMPEEDKFDSPYEELNLILEQIFKLVKANEEYWRLYFSLYLQPEMYDKSHEIMGNFYEVLIGKIEKVFKKLDVKSPKNEARIFGAMLDGMALHYFLLGDKYPISAVKKEIFRKYQSIPEK